MSWLRIAAAILAVTFAAPAYADTAKCEKTLLSGLRKYKKTYLKAFEKCLDAENEGKISGTPPVCPDTAAQVKIGTAASKINVKIDAACAPADLSGLGYGTTCALETAETPAETTCAGMSATTGAELAACLECWKAAELAEFIAIVYASHAVEVCGALDGSSTVCSELDCTTPQPNQDNLGNTAEETCQRAIAKAGIKYVLKSEKILESCGLAGHTHAQCLDAMMNPKVVLALASADMKKGALIKSKCGNNRTPTASPPFCCRTGTGNACTVVATRPDCLAIPGANVMEGKTCTAGTCSGGGPGSITWWENCPEGSTCPGPPVTTLNELINCVDTTADAIVGEMLCLQFPPGSGWDCPSEGSTTTTTASTTTTTT
ncbi:MAG TPA: hypothetical protein VKU61_08590 [Candidatus Binatia bacterium]|nr:hypothetical protein [Candidatus Binatia bacterium]